MSRAASLIVVGAVCLTGCSSQPSPTAPISVPVMEQVDRAPQAAGGNFGTPLSGDEEVPVRETRARGNAIFQLNAAGNAIDYKLIVANIENVFQAHIHRAPVGVNGPIAVWLYPSTAPVAGPLGQGRIDGVIATGTFTAANIVLANYTFEQLLADLRNGGAYVNVHTNDGVNPPNTGPGDFPGGELRGQVESRGHH